MRFSIRLQIRAVNQALLTVKRKKKKRKGTLNNMNVMRQTACLVVNPIPVYNFADLFNCMPVGRASDLMMFGHKAFS